MNVEMSRPFTGDVPAAFDAIQSILLPNGFRLEQRTEREIDFAGPGSRSSKENPVRGATRLAVKAAGGRLHLEAELGGVRFLTLFVIIFPMVLCGVLTVVIALTNDLDFGPAFLKVVPAFLVWPVIGPLMGALFRKRTKRALEVLLENAATIGQGR